MCSRAVLMLCRHKARIDSASQQALERLVDGAAAADVPPADTASKQSGGDSALLDGGGGGQHIEQLLQRLLLPRVKAALGEPNLAVRQVRACLQSNSQISLHRMHLQRIATLI
jgi:hypothetical protein